MVFASVPPFREHSRTFCGLAMFFCKFNRAVAKKFISLATVFFVVSWCILVFDFFVQIKFIREVGFDGFFVCKPTAKASVRCTY